MQRRKEAAEQYPSDMRLPKWFVVVRVVMQCCAIMYHLFNAIDKVLVDLFKIGGPH